MNLLMLTKFFPYGTGEAFIENEIEVLSKYYKKIVIIACEVPKGEKRVRTVPKNVEYYCVFCGNKKNDAIAGLKYVISSQETLKREYVVCKGFIQRMFLGYFEEKSQRVYRKINSAEVLKKLGDDPFVLYSYWLFMTARVGTLIAEDKVPIYMFSRTHRYDLYAEKNKINYLPFRRLLLSKYDSIFPCSDNGTEYLREKYPEYADKVHTAFLGTIDHGLGQFCDDGVFRIVSCSRIVPEKRVEKIVDALSLINEEQCEKIEWIHIGGGAGLDRIKEKTEEKLKKKHIRWEFLGDQPNVAVMKLYSEVPIDLFINVSSSEGLPVSIMEAISFGIPVIATDVGGTSEIVIDGITGKLVSCDCENQSLANEIVDFIKMKSTNEFINYRKTCREYWQEHFQALSNYQSLCEFLKTVQKK